jgi:hypothetical protein
MTATVVTPMPMVTTAEIWALVVVGMGEMPRVREKQSPDGRERGTFATGTVPVTAGPDGKSKALKTASVNVIEADPLILKRFV